jgi:drug/metabolite transporter (DMT)-like permease
MPVEVLGFWRLTIATFILLAWIFFKKISWPHFKDKKILWMLLSGFFFFLHLATYKFAAKNTTVSNTMILFASNPVWSSVGAILFFKEKLKTRLIFSYILAIIGIFILVQHKVQFSGQSFQGDLSSILSAFFYAVYMLTGKKARQHFNNSIYAFVQYLVCASLFAVTCLLSQQNLTGYSDISWIAVAGLILLPTLLGHLSLTYLVNFMNLSVMTCGKLIEPILASIMAYFVFHESLLPEAWIAFFLTSISVIILFAPDLPKAFKTTR